MTTRHSTFEFIGGDDWEILATLLDENGDPYDLTADQILWTLATEDGERLVKDGEYAVAVVDVVKGNYSIVTPASKTTSIRGGLFYDWVRIKIGGVTSTLATGPIKVTADPWRVAGGYQFSNLRVVA